MRDFNLPMFLLLLFILQHFFVSLFNILRELSSGSGLSEFSPDNLIKIFEGRFVFLEIVPLKKKGKKDNDNPEIEVAENQVEGDREIDPFDREVEIGEI